MRRWDEKGFGEKGVLELGANIHIQQDEGRVYGGGGYRSPCRIVFIVITVQTRLGEEFQLRIQNIRRED